MDKRPDIARQRRIDMLSAATESQSVPARASRAIYFLADRRYFLGAVALVNSLRLAGQREPIVMLDCGLTASQRRLLEQEVTPVETTAADHVALPFLLRAKAPLHSPAETMVLLDADIVVTRSLELVFRLAETGKVVAFEDALPGRHCPAWQEELGLPELRRQPYVNAGFLALSGESGLTLLRQLDGFLPLTDVSRSFWGKGDADDPFFFLDQDVVNGLLAGSFDRSDVVVLPHRLAPHPPFSSLVCDEASARCRYPDGEEPFLLHHVIRKPWLDPTPANPYTTLLTRFLLESDVPIRLAPRDLPLHLRSRAYWGMFRAHTTFRRRISSARELISVTSRMPLRAGR
jgi:hypothetical protein